MKIILGTYQGVMRFKQQAASLDRCCYDLTAVMECVCVCLLQNPNADYGIRESFVWEHVLSYYKEEDASAQAMIGFIMELVLAIEAALWAVGIYVTSTISISYAGIVGEDVVLDIQQEGPYV